MLDVSQRVNTEDVGWTIDAPTAVVVGPFTPSVFHPAWLAARWLISPDEATAARVQRVDPACARIRCGALTLEVTPGRLRAVGADDASSVLVRDFVVGVLTVLEHTEVSACGINRTLHRRAGPNVWGQLGKRLIGDHPFGLDLEGAEPCSVTVRGRRSGSPAEQLIIRIDPSDQLVGGGVCFDFNEHFALVPTHRSASAARDLLLAHWETAQQHFVGMATLFAGRMT